MLAICGVDAKWVVIWGAKMIFSLCNNHVILVFSLVDHYVTVFFFFPKMICNPFLKGCRMANQRVKNINYFMHLLEVDICDVPHRLGMRMCLYV